VTLTDTEGMFNGSSLQQDKTIQYPHFYCEAENGILKNTDPLSAGTRLSPLLFFVDQINEKFYLLPDKDIVIFCTVGTKGDWNWIAFQLLCLK
jgi:hypothetical protein